MKMRHILFLLPVFFDTNGLFAQITPPDSAIITDYYKHGEGIADNFPDSAEKLYYQAFQLSKKSKYQQGFFLFYRNMFSLYARMGEFEKGNVLLPAYLTEAEKTRSKYYLAQANDAIGSFYAQQNNNEKAISHYLRASLLFEEIKDFASLSITFLNSSIVFLALDQPENAIYYTGKAMEMIRDNEDTLSLIRAYSILGDVYKKLNNVQDEKGALQKMIAVAGVFNSDYLKCTSYIRYGEFLFAAGKTDSSLIYLEKARHIAANRGFRTEEAHTLIDLAELFRTKKITDADKKINEADVLLKGSDKKASLDIQRNYLDILYTIRKKQGRFPEALEAKEKWNILNDSIRNLQSQNKLAYFDKQLKQTEDRNRILAQQVQINKQKNVITSLLLGLLLLLVSGLIILFYQRKKQFLRAQQIQSLQKEQEFIAVKSSLEGQLQERSRISKEIHDELGSSLTSISLLCEVLKKRIDASQYTEIIRISDTSAEMVDKMNEIIWALSSTNDTVRSLLSYLRKFAHNFLKDADIEFIYSENGIATDRPMEGLVRRNIYLTIREAINNIVRHSGAKKVTMKVTMDTDLVIEVKDNGKGIDFTDTPDFRNGLRNMKRRMEETGGQLHVESNEGTLVRLNYSFTNQQHQNKI